MEDVQRLSFCEGVGISIPKNPILIVHKIKKKRGEKYVS